MNDDNNDSLEDLQQGNPTNNSWRTGKWTPEEEAYAEKIIGLFCTGQLILEPDDGRTLRTYLAKKLNCNPMRISKKFACLDGLGVRYRQVECSRDRIMANQEFLRPYEEAYRRKDMTIQSRRTKTKIVCTKDEAVKSKSNLENGYYSSDVDYLSALGAPASMHPYYSNNFGGYPPVMHPHMDPRAAFFPSSVQYHPPPPRNHEPRYTVAMPSNNGSFMNPMMYNTHPLQKQSSSSDFLRDLKDFSTTSSDFRPEKKPKIENEYSTGPTKIICPSACSASSRSSSNSSSPQTYSEPSSLPPSSSSDPMALLLDAASILASGFDNGHGFSPIGQQANKPNLVLPQEMLKRDHMRVLHTGFDPL